MLQQAVFSMACPNSTSSSTNIPCLQRAAELGFRGRQAPLQLVALLLRRRRCCCAARCRCRCLLLVLLARALKGGAVLLVHSSQGGRQLAQLLRGLALPRRHLAQLLLPLLQLASHSSQLRLQLLLPPPTVQASCSAGGLQLLRRLPRRRGLLPRRRQLGPHPRQLSPGMLQLGSLPRRLAVCSLLHGLAGRLAGVQLLPGACQLILQILLPLPPRRRPRLRVAELRRQRAAAALQGGALLLGLLQRSCRLLPHSRQLGVRRLRRLRCLLRGLGRQRGGALLGPLRRLGLHLQLSLQRLHLLLQRRRLLLQPILL